MKKYTEHFLPIPKKKLKQILYIIKLNQHRYHKKLDLGNKILIDVIKNNEATIHAISIEELTPELTPEFEIKYLNLINLHPTAIIK